MVDTEPDLQVAEIISPGEKGAGGGGLYLGSQDAAADLDLLKSHEITHVLNVASGVDNFFPDQFVYRRIELLDVPETVFPFSDVIDFLSKGKTDHGANIFVHCNAGVSRYLKTLD